MKHFILGFIAAILVCVIAVFFSGNDKVPEMPCRILQNPVSIDFEKTSSTESSSENRDNGIVIIPKEPMSAIE